MNITVDASRAKKAGLPEDGPAGRSFFCRAAGEGVARLRVWRDDDFRDAMLAVRQGIAETFHGVEEVIIEVGTAGRHA